MVLAIPGICVRIEKFSARKRSVYIVISAWNSFDFGYMSAIIVSGRHRWRSEWTWRWFWCRLPGSLRCKCTWFFAPPGCQWILGCTILGREAADRLIFLNHSLVSFNCSLQIFIPRILNPLVRYFSDFGLRFLIQALRLLYCGVRKPSLGHIRHIQRKAHVRLF